ncbi:hypothetical protein LCGC14_1806660, partial [marine sediment metagenome]
LDQRIDDPAGFAIQCGMALTAERAIAKVTQRAASLDKGDKCRVLLCLRGRAVRERQAGKGQNQQ